MASSLHIYNNNLCIKCPGPCKLVVVILYLPYMLQSRLFLQIDKDALCLEDSSQPDGVCLTLCSLYSRRYFPPWLLQRLFAAIAFRTQNFDCRLEHRDNIVVVWVTHSGHTF